jgi:hypothetical protein
MSLCLIVFNGETQSVTGRFNPRRVFPINTSGRHETSNHEQPQATNASGFSPSPLLESRSPEPSSSAILHGGRIRFLESDLRNCSIRFIKLFIIARLPLHWLRVEPHHIYRELRQSAHDLQEPTVVKEVTYVFNSPILSYILNMLIYVGMILLDNLLQCFLFIAMIDLSRTCESTIVLICSSLVMFMSYFWIKIK